MANDNALIALESFVGRVDGKELMFRKGDLVAPSHPAVKKWPALFGPAHYPHDLPVEQATAAPGEKRGK